MTTTRAAIEQALPDPAAWVSFDVLTQKERLDRKPITSLQPGVYQHSKLFSEAQMHEFADARVKALEGELVRVREALSRIAQPSSCGCKPCTGECSCKEALKVTLEIIREEARAALSPTTTKD